MGYYDFKTNSSSAQSALYLGEFNSGVEIDVSAKYSKYGLLTEDNFAVVPLNGTASAGYYGDYYGAAVTQMAANGTASGTYTFDKTYNSSTGKLTLTNTVKANESGKLMNGYETKKTYSASNTKLLKAKVYLLPSIQDVS